jgi:hypothetical protein
MPASSTCQLHWPIRNILLLFVLVTHHCPLLDFSATASLYSLQVSPFIDFVILEFLQIQPQMVVAPYSKLCPSINSLTSGLHFYLYTKNWNLSLALVSSSFIVFIQPDYQVFTVIRHTHTLTQMFWELACLGIPNSGHPASINPPDSKLLENILQQSPFTA